MFNLISEAKEAVLQKNKNIALISQQYKTIQNLEEKIQKSKRELKETKQKLESYSPRVKSSKDELSALQFQLKKKKTELDALDKKLLIKFDAEERIENDLNLVTADLNSAKAELILTEDKIAEKSLLLNYVEIELNKSDEEKKSDGIIRLVSVMEQCAKLKEHSLKYYTF